MSGPGNEGNTAGQYSRRGLLHAGLAASGGLLVAACGGTGTAVQAGRILTTTPTAQATPAQLTAAQAWARLVEGNRRWVSGGLQHPDQNIVRRRELAFAQYPFAVVVSCIDSRVPPETVFDQGIGDLFVIRTGAQTIDRLITASIEYGPVENGTPLVVVLGHQRCGAVQATVDSIEKNEHLPGNLGAIVDAIRPAYEEAHGTGGDIVDQTVRSQILRTVAALEGDAVLAGHVRDNSLGIVGVYYNLDTGQVSVLKTAGFIPS